MKTVLHVGCGPQDIRSLPFYFNSGEWSEVRYDIDESVSPDILGDLRDLSFFEDESLDAIYSSHNIEHVSEYEVQVVLSGFFKKLKKDGFCTILCPDIKSVAEEVLKGNLNTPLYQSSAGPISAIDIIYGHQAALKNGKYYMAHKTAFTAEILAQNLIMAGFSFVHMVRDKFYGLHAVAFLTADEEYMRFITSNIFPGQQFQKDYLRFARHNI